MFDIGFSELLLFGVIALIVLGPEKLPQAARTAGQWYAKLRRTVSTLQSEIEAEFDLAETRQQMQDELAKIRQTEANMKREMAEMRGSMQEFESSQDQSLRSSYESDIDDQDYLEQDVYEQDVYEQDVYEQNYHAQDEFEPVEHGYYNQQQEDDFAIDNATNESTYADQPIATKPWENMWFRLGSYDKTRRLPAAPYLPNYQADALLHTDNINLANNNANTQAELATRVDLAKSVPSHSLHKPETD